MNSPRLRFAAVLIIALSAEAASAQQGITLQLPTFRQFSVATTVVVPDRGGAYLGGIGSARSGRSTFGLPGGRGQTAFGHQRGAAGMHVSAHIHDLKEMDGDLLAGQSADGIARSKVVAAAPAVPGLREIEQQRLAQDAADQAEAADFFRRGNIAHAAGKTSLAKTYWNMALRRATGQLREQITASLSQIQDAPPPRLAER